MPNFSSYPPTSDIPGMVPGASPMQANTGAEKMMNPFFQALKIIGVGIKTAEAAGSPNAPGMSRAYSGLLQSMGGPQMNQGMQAPVTPQAPMPQAPQAPAPRPVPQAPAPVPQAPQAPKPIAPMPQPNPMGQRAGQVPFGTPGKGQRPVNKQPVIL